jgi:hypothetical protein
VSKHSHDDATLDAVALVETFLSEDIEGMAAVLPNVNAAEVALVLVKLTASLLAAHGRRAEGYEAPVPCPEPGCFRAWALEEVNKP